MHPGDVELKQVLFRLCCTLWRCGGAAGAAGKDWAGGAAGKDLVAVGAAAVFAFAGFSRGTQLSTLMPQVRSNSTRTSSWQSGGDAKKTMQNKMHNRAAKNPSKTLRVFHEVFVAH